MYSLRKCHRILKDGNRIYRRKWIDCPSDRLHRFENLLAGLDQAILSKRRMDAHEHAVDLETFLEEHFAPSTWTKTRDLILAITLALAIALLVRQVFVEHMHIPSGSMRPSFKEGDCLLVSKTRYGINLPLQAGHVLFDADLVTRMEPMVFSSHNLDVLNSKHNYLGIIPSQLQLIKRVIGKPGDSLYFYGGKVWGIDREGRELTELRENPETAHLEQIPFRIFEGKPNDNGSFSHMGVELPAEQLGRAWGMGNYAMARLLTRDQLEAKAGSVAHRLAPAPLYLELSHGPRIERGRLRTESSFLPLRKKHLDRLMQRMSTSRFWVHNGRVYLKKGGIGESARTALRYPGIDDGCYEIDRGRPLKIAWGSHAWRLPKDHALLSRQPSNVQRLFNTGIDLSSRCDPSKAHAPFPSRYAYFRDGDLCLFGEPIVKKDEAILEEFLAWEEWLEETQKGYRAFVDRGAPVTGRGHIDHAFVEEHGLKVPEGHYLLLGDNHSVSRDSRRFGFVPEANLRGSPSGIIWPWNSRKATRSATNHALLTLPWLLTWGTLTLFCTLCYSYSTLRRRKPLFRKLST